MIPSIKIKKAEKKEKKFIKISPIQKGKDVTAL
jgi:hypothetical protein